MFARRSVVSRQNCYTSTDLYYYTEAVLKSLQKNRRRATSRSNYSWLSSAKKDELTSEIEMLRPFFDKMSPESCTAIALQIDKLTDSDDVTPAIILSTLKNLLEQHYSCQIVAGNVTALKRRKSAFQMFRHNKVKPELMPPGREATVSFIINEYF